MNIDQLKLNPLVKQLLEDYFMPKNLDTPKEMLLLDTLLLLSVVACWARVHSDYFHSKIYPNMYAIKIASSGIGKDRPLNQARKDLLPMFLELAQKEYNLFLKNYQKEPWKYIQEVSYIEYETLDKHDKRKLVEKYQPYDFQFTFENATIEGMVSQAQTLGMFGLGGLFCKNSEFGAYMGGVGDTSKQEFLVALQKGYDNDPFGGKIIKGSKQVPEVKDVPINFLGNTTDDWIKNPEQKETIMKFIKGGVGRRTFIYYPQEYYFEEFGAQEYMQEDERAHKNALLLERTIKELYVKGKASQTLELENKTKEICLEYQRRIKRSVQELTINDTLVSDARIGEYKGRLMKAVRLMTLFAFLDDSLTVKPEHAKQAIQLVNFYSQFATGFFETQELSAGELYARYLIKASPRKVTKTQLKKLNHLSTRTFYRDFENERENIDIALDELGYELVEIKQGRGNYYQARKVVTTQLNKIPIMLFNALNIKPEEYQKKIAFATQYKREDVHFNELDKVVKQNAYMPQLMAQGKRAKKNLIPGGSLVGLDFDEGLTLDQIKQTLESERLSALVITTKSHAESNHRFRVLLPLKTPFTGSQNEWKSFYTNFSRSLGGKNDPACSDVSRFYYPSPRDAKHFYTKGDMVDWRRYVQEEKPKEKKVDRNVSDPVAHAVAYVTDKYGTVSEGERDNVLNNIYSFYKYEKELPLSEVFEVVREVNNRCLSKPFATTYLEKWNKDR